MIKSMTGFGRHELLKDQRKFSVELRSVNHRYLDINIKMPKKIGYFENNIRTVLKEYIQRGKVDVFINYEDDSEKNFSLKYNEALANEYYKFLTQMADRFQIENDVKVSSLSRYPDVFTMEEAEVDENAIWEMLEETLRKACEKFVESRIHEGSILEQDLLGKLDQMLVYVSNIEERSPEIMKEYRERLEGKIQELLGDNTVDEGRIATEITIFADKICVDEETVRLRSHVESMRRELQHGGSIGRKLDFIAQEMNREANTILSKANDLAISDTGINLKTDIEKVREQIQNIE